MSYKVSVLNTLLNKNQLPSAEQLPNTKASPSYVPGSELSFFPAGVGTTIGSNSTISGSGSKSSPGANFQPPACIGSKTTPQRLFTLVEVSAPENSGK